MSIRSDNTCNSVHRWELTFNTGVYVNRCSRCDTKKVVSMRNKLCLLCRKGNYEETSICYGGLKKVCGHGLINSRHLLLQCTNSKCRIIKIEDFRLA